MGLISKKIGINKQHGKKKRNEEGWGRLALRSSWRRKPAVCLWLRPKAAETKAKAETDLVEAKENKEAVMLELEQLSNYKAELHQSCDFVLKTFWGKTIGVVVLNCAT